MESTEQTLLCALHGLDSLVQTLGLPTVLMGQGESSDFIDTFVAVLRHPSSSVRLSAATCLQSISAALPSLTTRLIDTCLEKINSFTKPLPSSNADALSGFALALEALLGSVNRCPLGKYTLVARIAIRFDSASL